MIVEIVIGGTERVSDIHFKQHLPNWMILCNETNVHARLLSCEPKRERCHAASGAQASEPPSKHSPKRVTFIDHFIECCASISGTTLWD